MVVITAMTPLLKAPRRLVPMRSPVVQIMCIRFFVESRRGNGPSVRRPPRPAAGGRRRRKGCDEGSVVRKGIRLAGGRLKGRCLQWSRGDDRGRWRGLGWRATGLAYRDERARGRC